MSLRINWYLPTSGDGRTLASADSPLLERADGGAPGRAATIPYLGQIARSAEQLGFEAALIPTGTWCADAWIVAAALSQVTERLKFLVAFRPGQISPTLAAQQAATFQRLLDGRLLLNVVTGGEEAEQRRYGDFLDKDARYARTDEFLTIVRGAWSGEPYSFDGEHLSVDGALVVDPPAPPGIYFGGSSGAALPVAARHSDVYLTWGEPPAQAAEKIERVRELAEAEGRSIRFGIRMHVVTRERSSEAWTAAARLLDGLGDEDIDAAQALLRQSSSEGQRRMLELNRGSRDNLEVYPNVWAGVGLVRGGAGTALVGSHEEVAERIAEYASVGFDEFIFSGYPHLEELYNLGEGVFPLLRRRGLLAGSRAVADAVAA
ncbi:MAG: LLM class flavin-dependent oxidoreductase [Actinomycetota bacterium]